MDIYFQNTRFLELYIYTNIQSTGQLDRTGEEAETA